MSQTLIPLAVPELGEEEWQAVREPLFSGWVVQGPKTLAFEKAFAQEHGVSHALATTSCTTALHLALLALGIGPGDEVIVPSFTWVATANAVLYCGATPILADVDPVSFLTTPEEFLKRLTPRTKAVVPVHLFGLCVDVMALRAVLPPDVRIVEDAACAAGGQVQGQSPGGLGDVAAFSFHPRKSITTGEGGMVTTNDDALASKVAILRNHGLNPAAGKQPPHYMPPVDDLGYNYRMTDIQAAVGLVQLGKLNRFIDTRAAGARRYAEGLAGINWLTLPSEPQGGRHAWQAYVVSVDPSLTPVGRDGIMDLLAAQGIQTRPGTQAVHMLGYYADRFGYRPEDLPGAQAAAANSMALPLHTRMSDDDYSRVIAALKDIG
ncbi:DegT/DnrJ/EryC1/StrS family aminotransferase [Lacibacterium aquatile]|uniref:DegT/DnrJ/EryC1/StrS family aminotransferase n=1 Tax=Lacibacterium aquatile TaxID=1168082 RepID=A0ABW5DSC9_9PROT